MNFLTSLGVKLQQLMFSLKFSYVLIQIMDQEQQYLSKTGTILNCPSTCNLNQSILKSQTKSQVPPKNANPFYKILYDRVQGTVHYVRQWWPFLQKSLGENSCLIYLSYTFSKATVQRELYSGVGCQNTDGQMWIPPYTKYLS